MHIGGLPRLVPLRVCRVNRGFDGLAAAPLHWLLEQPKTFMKTVLITGANRGLGYEVERQLSERCWRILLTARRKTEGAAAAAKLKNASFLQLDISDSANVRRAAKEVSALDVL